MADRVPKTRDQAAAKAHFVHECLLAGYEETAEEAFDELAAYFDEEGGSA